MTKNFQLEVSKVSVAYDRIVLKEASFFLEKGKRACLIGPSGSGKSTLLRALAGLEHVCQGSIRLDGREISSPSRTVAPEKRGVGIVFQDFALFPHLNVAENISFALGSMSKRQRKQRVFELIEMMDLAGLEEKYPHELSGGQQQRVAIARALAPRPGLLLLDEPFSQLDPTLRGDLLGRMRKLLDELGITAVIVTHQQEDAMILGDYMGVLHEGELLQWGNPFEVYHEPAHPFVANFIGRGAFLNGTYAGKGTFQTELGLLGACKPEDENCHVDLEENASVRILVRPDDVQLEPSSPFKARVLEKSFQGAYHLYRLALPSGQQILTVAPSHHDYPEGEQIGIRVEMDHVVHFGAESLVHGAR